MNLDLLIDALLDEVSQVCGMPDAATVDDLREDLRVLVSAHLFPLYAENERLRAKNDELLGRWAESAEPCLYCNLPAAEIAKCPSGFPGCGRMDDVLAWSGDQKDEAGHA